MTFLDESSHESAKFGWPSADLTVGKQVVVLPLRGAEHLDHTCPCGVEWPTIRWNAIRLANPSCRFKIDPIELAHPHFCCAAQIL